jgi:DNA-binding NarL/FixJ family response regulator
MTGPPERVLVVSDSDAVAAKIEAMLRAPHDRRVLVGSPRSLVRLIEEHDPTAVILASTTARAVSTLATTAGIVRVPPLILLVEDPHAAWTSAARRAGVRAVLDRDAPAGEIAAALTAVTAGLIALHPDVLRGPRAAAVEAVAESALTVRERDVLEMLAEGLSNQMIAHRLHISTYTVKFHVASILGKLGAASRTEAVTLGVRRGLISL